MTTFYILIGVFFLGVGLVYLGAFLEKRFPKPKTSEESNDIISVVVASKSKELEPSHSNTMWNIDYERLDNWYRNNSRQNSAAIKFNVFLPLVLGIIWLFLSKQMQEVWSFEERLGVPWERSNLEAMKFGANVTVVTVIVSLLTFYIPLANSNNRLESIRYQVLKREQFRQLWAFIDSLALKLKLSIDSLSIYYLKTDGFEAHVEQKNDRINLYLSRGLISHYSQNKDDVEAIIAHEFGHIYQKDTRFLLVSSNLFILPSILLTLGILITLINGGTESVKFIAVPFTTLVTLLSLMRKRKKCEYMADLASIAFLQKTTIKEVLSQYMTNKVSFWYPSRDERITHINQMLKQFQRNTQRKELVIQENKIDSIQDKQ